MAIVRTNIGVLHEKDHPEPWIIAMDAKPGKHTVLDYGMRWGIEAMFSDFKSRGFGLMKSHIQKPERLERLILVMSMTMYWALSCGAAQQHKEAGRAEKKPAQTTEIAVFPVQTGLTLLVPLFRRIWENSRTLANVDKLRGGK